MEGNKKLQTASPQQASSPTVTKTSAKSITILMELYLMENRKILKTEALVDSGATISCIDRHLVNRMKWPLEKLWEPMFAQNADGTNNARGAIQHQITLQLRIQGITKTEIFYVLNLGKRNNIILGYPWLMKNNSQIDWGAGELQMIGTPTPQHDDPEIIEQ